MSDGPVLRHVGERRRLHLAGITLQGRRRRPSGEADPLPHTLRGSARVWLVIAGVVVIIWILLFVVASSSLFWTQRDLSVLRWIEGLRTDFFDSVFKGLHAVGSIWTVRPLRWGILLALVIVRHWRHLFAFLGSIVIAMFISRSMSFAVSRPRPVDIEIIGNWEGFAHPSLPVTDLGVTLVAGALALIPLGRWRDLALWASGGVLGLLGLARIYLGTDHPTDVLVAIVIAFAVAVIVSRLYTPEAVFPVHYSRGRTAHLSVDGDRGGAIRKAIKHQLGLEVMSIKPFALEGSAGSTPLKIEVEAEEGKSRELFGKLYAANHLRSDRWYKIGRTILYGALEDEGAFNSVRRLVEYEDYMLRYLRDEGFDSAEPYGFVEITADREYLIVTSFLDGAKEIGDVTVTEELADRALAMIRQLWVCGVAHRDIKPSNLLVLEGQVHVIDVAFATIRPSPWRQAVDLANMVLIVSLTLDPEKVFEIAQRYFTTGDIAEAFAATRSITVPGQLRSELKAYEKERGVDLIQVWRDMTGNRDPIAIQRWSIHRVAVTARVVGIGLIALVVVLQNLTGGGFI